MAVIVTVASRGDQTARRCAVGLGVVGGVFHPGLRAARDICTGNGVEYAVAVSTLATGALLTDIGRCDRVVVNGLVVGHRCGGHVVWGDHFRRNVGCVGRRR